MHRLIHTSSHARAAAAFAVPSRAARTRCAVPNPVEEGSAPAPATPASARTTNVREWRSDPGTVARKAAELAALRPGGPLQAATFALQSPLIWAAAAFGQLPRLLRAAVSPPPALPPRAALPFPLHEEFVTVNGLRLHAVSPAPRDPSKPLMLLLHGFPELWYSWRWQMAEFAGDYDVVAIDMRGYNDSERPQGVAAYRLEQLAADVHAAVSALGHKRCTLVAHDWGGSVAWAVAGLYGSQLLDRLIVMGLPHLGVGLTNMDATQRAKSSYILLFQAPLLPELILTAGGAEALRDTFCAPPAGVCNPGVMGEGDVAWYREAMLKPGAATAMLNYYRAFMRTMTLADQPGDADVWRALRARIDVPTLVLHGDQDVALGTRLLEGMEAAFAPGGVDIKLLDNCSHWVQMDYPLQVNAIMRDWLRRHGGT